MSPRRVREELADFQVLGPLRVVVGGVEVPIATRRQRALLVLLAASVGRVVPSERLIDQLWDGAPPPQAPVTLRSYVSNVRQALGGQEGAGSVLATRDQGYVLDVPPASVDAVRLGRLAEEGREHLRQGRPQEALEAFDAAVRTWRGDPLAEVAEHEAVRSSISALNETYLSATEGRFEALLAVGRHVDALPDLEAFVADHPLREEPVALLMLALYRAGRAPEALEAHRRFRTRLDEELGIDPSTRLDELHRRVLERHPSLAPPSARPATHAPSPASPIAEDAIAAPAASAAPAAAGRPDGASAEQTIAGRARELAAARSHLDTLGTLERGCVLLVSGEPGIGKSTLLAALESDARSRGFAVHSGRVPAASGVPAFWPWLQVVDSIAAGLEDEALRTAVAGAARPLAQLSVAVAERIGHPLPMLGDSPQVMRLHLYEAVSAFLRQAMPSRPVVITLDDLHWADLPSLELLSYLTPTTGSRPLMLVAAYRDLPADRSEALDATLATVSREDVAHELPLSGLRPADVAHLIDALAAGERSDADRGRLAALLHERTGGNPFFVRQLARLLLEDEGRGADALSLPAPPGVRHVIARRLAALSDPVRELLAAAAVIGREFELRTAADAAGMDIGAALDAFDEAARHGLVETAPAGAERRFVHALVQEVVLDQWPAGRLARLHAAVAGRLQREGTAGPDALARHLWAARDIVGAAAVPALVAAAESAAAVYALEQAEDYLRRALELVRTEPAADPSTELSLLLGLFRLILIGRGWGHAEGRSVIDRAMVLAEAGAYSDANSHLWWSMVFYLIDRNDPAYVEVGRTLLAALEEADRSGRGSERNGAGPQQTINHAARAVVRLTAIYSALDADDRDSAWEHFRAAEAHIDAAEPQDLAAFDEHLHVMTLLIEGSLAAITSDQAGYRRSTDAAIALADADGRPFPRAVARTLSAANGVFGAEPAFVLELARQAGDLDSRFGFAWLNKVATCIRAWAEAHVHGVTAESVAAVEEALADMRVQGRLGSTAIIGMMLGDLYALQGRRAAARETYLRAREDPGPYRGLMVERLDERLDGLARS